MYQLPEFPGFPQAGLDFLDQLKRNNNRDWFNAHKQAYLDNVQQPAVELVAALGARLQEISADIIFDTRTNGAGSLFRIHRDTRFSEDKTPYKLMVDMLFWEGEGKKTECPGMGLRITAEGGGAFTGMHHFPKPMLAAYREAVVNPSLGGELEMVLESVRGAGKYEIGGDHYKRVPTGFDPDHRRADLLRYNALYAHSPALTTTMLTSPDLVDICFEHLLKMSPIHHWLVKVARQAGG
jgi:uncharacterized protein (TIGR02453 family)